MSSSSINKDMEELIKLGKEMGKKQSEEMLKEAEKMLEGTTTKTSSPTNFNFSNNSSLELGLPIGLFLLSLPFLILWYKLQKKIKIAKFVLSLQIISLALILLILNKTFGLLFIGGIALFYFKTRGLQEHGEVKKRDIKDTYKQIKNISPGIVIGLSQKGLIVKESSKDGHVLVSGGSGTGKSQCVSIPTLLNWDGSALVIDIKRELYAYTNKARRAKGKVYVFDPEQQGHGYDPIALCTTVDSCQFLSRSLIPLPPGTNDPFWIENAQAVLASAVFEGNREGKTLPEIAERILITEPEKLVQELTNSKYREAILLASPLKGTPEKTLGGIFTQLKSKLISLASDENLRLALSTSDFTPESLEEVSTIYLRISENQLSQYKPLFNLMITQFTRYFSARGEGKQPPILMLLDELPRFEKVPDYGESLSTLRSRNIHILSAVQSVGQLDLYYGKEMRRSILDNKPFKLILSTTDAENQKMFSDMSGKAKVKQKSLSFGLGNSSVSEYQQWEERIQGSKFGQLKDTAIYFEPGEESYEVTKVVWFQVPELLELQKRVGGPTSFLAKEDILKLSKIEPVTKDIDIRNISINLEKVKEKIIEDNNNSLMEDTDEFSSAEESGENTEYKLLDEWEIVK